MHPARFTTKPALYDQTNWLSELHHSGVAATAKRLGLTLIERPSPGSLSPCPSCSAERRGSHDRRGPVGLTRNGLGWRCHRCKSSGDAIRLAALVLTGQSHPDKDGWRRIRSQLINDSPLPSLPPTPQTKQRPPLDEVQELWRRCAPVYDDRLLRSLLTERGLDPAVLSDRDLCRSIPEDHLPAWASFRRSSWSQTGHRCLFGLYDHHGNLQSLHARRISCDAEQPKGLSPVGYEVSGLCFLESGAQLLFQDKAPQITQLLIVEGPPDFLSTASYLGDANDHTAVAGILSGSWTPCFSQKLPPGIEVVLMTHEDPAGEQYAQKIKDTLRPETQITRWRYAHAIEE